MAGVCVCLFVCFQVFPVRLSGVSTECFTECFHRLLPLTVSTDFFHRVFTLSVSTDCVH